MKSTPPHNIIYVFKLCVGRGGPVNKFMNATRFECGDSGRN